MAIVKELQTTAAFKIRANIHEKKAMQKKEMEGKMYDAFHGNPDKGIAPFVEFLYNGQNDFAELYEDNIVTDTSVSDASSTSRKIRTTLTNDYRLNHTVGTDKKRDITKELLRQKTKKSQLLIPGDTLYSAGLTAHANGKKMIAIAESWCDPGPKLPSGKTMEDFYAHVLSEFGKLEGSKNGELIVLDDVDLPNPNLDDSSSSGESKEQDEDVSAITEGDASNAPKANEPDKSEVFKYANGKFPKGWFAFVLYGTLSGNLSGLFAQDDFLKPNESKEEAGRKAARKREREEKDNERKADPTGKRGATLQNKTDTIYQVQQDISQQQQDADSKFAQLSTLIRTLNAEIHTQLEMAKLICPKYNKEHEEWKKLDDLRLDLANAREDLRSMNESKPTWKVKNKMLRGVVNKQVDKDTFIDLCGESDDDGAADLDLDKKLPAKDSSLATENKDDDSSDSDDE